jgi:hypothetical protein
MAAAKTVNLRGAGGLEQTFDLPLRELFADQVARGQLQPVGLEDEAALASSSDAPAVAAADADDARPADKANKATWAAYAVSIGMDPDEAAKASKADLQAFTPAEPDPAPADDGAPAPGA